MKNSMSFQQSEARETIAQESQPARWRNPIPLIAIPNMALIFLVVIGLSLYFQRQIRNMRLNDLEDQLTAEAKLVGIVLESSFDRGDPVTVFDQLARQYADLLGARITIIASDGLVLGESDEDRTKMDNHLSRPEVQQALVEGSGKQIRFSNTLKYNLMYLAVPVISRGEIVAFSRVALPMLEIEAGLASLRVNLGVVAAFSVLFALFLTVFFSERTARPLRELADTAQRITAGDLTRVVLVKSRGEVGTLQRAFDQMTTQLRELITSLEQRVAERTLNIERRSQYLRASVEVSNAIISILDMDQLTLQVTELIRERFELYYVGLFLVDEAGEWAVLRAGSGSTGQALLSRGYRIKIGSGMIGWSIANAQARVALSAEDDMLRLAMEGLPETRSEATLPLRSRGNVLGAISVHSTQPDAFDPDTLAMLQTMADQVAVALDNARLFAQSQQTLETMRRAYGELSQQAWTELLRTRPDLGYRSDTRGVSEAGEIWRPEMEQAVQQKNTVRNAQVVDRHVLAVPIKLGDEVIGVLDTYKPAPDGEWSPDEIVFLEELTGQLALALESARLYQDTQRRAARERVIGEVTGRIRETLNMETMLRTAAEQMRQALDLDDLVVRLASPQAAKLGAEDARAAGSAGGETEVLDEGVA